MNGITRGIIHTIRQFLLFSNIHNISAEKCFVSTARNVEITDCFLITGLNTAERAATSLVTQQRRRPLYSEQSGDIKYSVPLLGSGYYKIMTIYRTINTMQQRMFGETNVRSAGQGFP
jgi:hypothetical protein